MKLKLPLPPCGINHTYKQGQGHWYKEPKLADWEEECLWLIKKQKPEIAKKNNYAVTINFNFDTKRGFDIDSRIKIVLDLLQKAGIYENDSLVNELHVYKKYVHPKLPGMEIEVI